MDLSDDEAAVVYYAFQARALELLEVRSRAPREIRPEIDRRVSQLLQLQFAIIGSDRCKAFERADLAEEEEPF